jgi:hypothetical protein
MTIRAWIPQASACGYARSPHSRLGYCSSDRNESRRLNEIRCGGSWKMLERIRDFLNRVNDEFEFVFPRQKHRMVQHEHSFAGDH